MPLYRAACFALVHATHTCWSCQQPTPVSAILLPAEHTVDWEDDEGLDQGHGATLLGNLLRVDPQTRDVLRQHAPQLGIAQSRTAEFSYVGNLCRQCRALQGDFYLRQPGAPFFPLNEADEARLTASLHHNELQVTAEGAESSWMDRLWGLLE